MKTVRGWQPIETAPRDMQLMFWVRASTTSGDDTYFVDTSGNPIIAQVAPHLHMGIYGSWSSLMKATHWTTLPEPPV